MGGKIKNLFHKIVSGKKALFFSLGLVLVLSLAPLNSAEAFGFNDLVGFVSNIWTALAFGIPLAIVTGILYIGAFAMLVIASALSEVLKGIISASTAISVLPNKGIEVIDVGWKFSQGFVNIIFILILAYIGLATILRLQTYQMQKTLPGLIIIALLVNFSGVLVGFVVDISNILINSFVSNPQFGGWGLLTSGAGGLLKDVGASITGVVLNVSAVGNIFVPAAKAAVLLLFFLSFSLALLVTALLFIVRVGVLWILTILAPLAFACYILPATKKFWNQWLEALIQWSIIGIPMVFFLFLSQIAVAKLSGVTALWTLAPATGLEGVIVSLIGPTTALLFIVVGAMLSMQMAPASAKAIINFGQKAGLKAAKWGGRAAGTAIGRRVSPKIESWGKKLTEKGQKMAEISPGQRKGLKWGVGKLTGWAGRGVEVGTGLLYRQVKTADGDEIKAGRKEAAGKDSADNFRAINEELTLKPKGLPINWNRIIGMTLGTIDNGDTNDLQAALRNGTLSPKIVGRALLAAQQRMGPPAYRPIAKAMYGRLLNDPDQFGDKFETEKDSTTGEVLRDADGVPKFISKDKEMVSKIVKEVPEKLTTAEIAAKILGDTIDKGKTNGEEFKLGGELVIKQIIEVRGGDLASALVRRPETREGRAEMLKAITRADPEDLYKKGAGGLIRYLSSTAAQGAGIVSSLTPAETNELLQLLRDKSQAAAQGQQFQQRLIDRLNQLIAIWKGP